MKKIISLIASVAILCSMATSAFAFSGSVTGATIEDKTISVKSGEAFTFKFTGDQAVKGGSSIKADLSGLVNAGWTISAYSSGSADATVNLTSANLLQIGWAAGSNYDLTDVVMLEFTATPGSNAAGATFKVSPTVLKAVGGLYNTATTYTVEIAAAQEKKTTATIGANGEVTFDYADADAADAKLADKKVVLGTANVAGTEIGENTTVKVTYTDGAVVETKTFGETLYETLTVEGAGSLETKSIRFGIVCDKTMTGTFSFALN